LRQSSLLWRTGANVADKDTIFRYDWRTKKLAWRPNRKRKPVNLQRWIIVACA